MLKRSITALSGKIKEFFSRLRLMSRERPMLFWGSCAITAAMLVVFLLWWRKPSDSFPVSRVCAVVSAALFTYVLLRVFHGLLADWTSAPAAPARLTDKHGALFALRLFLSLIIVEIVIVCFVYLIQIANQQQTSFKDSIGFWERADGPHYLDIARDWYLSEGSVDRIVQLVFLPGFPLVIRAMHLLVHNYLYAAMLVSALSFAGAGTVFYYLCRLDMDHDTALRALRYVVLMPGVFFFVAPMTESLFFLLSLACTYLARRRKWLPACILGGLAAFTRSLGLMLAVLVGYEMLMELRHPDGKRRSLALRVLRLIPIVLIPAGFGAYCLISKNVSGNAFQWMIYQRDHWHQQLGLFFHTAAYQTDYAVKAFRDQDTHMLFGLWLPNLVCSFAALLIAALAAGRLRTSYRAYFLAYFVVAIGPSWLLSAPRYLLVLFPTVLGIAELTRSRRADALFTILMTGASAYYLLLFVNSWQVW